MRAVTLAVRPIGGQAPPAVGPPRAAVQESAPLPGPPVPPAASARQAWPVRCGVLVVVGDADGLVGQGEASPLPGHSPDTLAACAAALAAVAPGALVVDEARPVVPQIAALVARLPAALPAARFALETALLDLVGQRLGRAVWELLAGDAPAIPPPVPLAQLLPRGEAALAAAHTAWARGVRTLKLKVGAPGAWADELDLATRLRAELPGAALRLDANRAFAADEVAGRLADLAPLAPELVEEPTVGYAGLSRSPVPLAADESLAPAGLTEEHRTAIARGVLRALVLKPALLGGSLRCLELVRAAGALSTPPAVLVTHLFDGPVALAAAADLALALAARADVAVWPCGLAPHAALAAYPPVTIAGLGPAELVATSGRRGLGLPPLAERR